MAQGKERTRLVAASGSDSDVLANTTGRSHRRRKIMGGTVGLGVALAVGLWWSYGRKDSATPAFMGDFLVSLAESFADMAEDEKSCGHRASVCRNSGTLRIFFTIDCLSGGLGCNALGYFCCRYCETGPDTPFESIKCDVSDSLDTYLKQSTAQEPAPAPAPADDFAPSSAPLYEFYMYRAIADGELDRYPVGDLNAANADGVLWYLLNEVVTMYTSGVRCPRKFDISSIHRFKIKYRAPEILLTENYHFGVRFAYDYGACSGRCFDDNQCTGEADCAEQYQKYGYTIGCNNFVDHYPWPTFDTSALHGVWYSLPLQGRCDGIPTGTGHCTWSYEDAGFITLKDLESTSPGDNNCCADSCSNFWDDEYNPDATPVRVSKLLELFQNNYPEVPSNLDEPRCDFNQDKWYAVDEWPTHQMPYPG